MEKYVFLVDSCATLLVYCVVSVLMIICLYGYFLQMMMIIYLLVDCGRCRYQFEVYPWYHTSCWLCAYKLFNINGPVLLVTSSY